jgi:hypothetical protein
VLTAYSLAYRRFEQSMNLIVALSISH